MMPSVHYITGGNKWFSPLRSRRNSPKTLLPLREGQLKEWFLNVFGKLLQASPFSRNSLSSATQVRNGLLIREEANIPTNVKRTISPIKHSSPLADVKIQSYIKHISKDTQLQVLSEPFIFFPTP